MKILITGIRGFVGGSLAKSLAKGNTVYGLSRTDDPIECVEKVYSWQHLDRLPPVDAIIHAAALVHETYVRPDESEYTQVNVRLTQTIFDRFAASDASVFIFLSSVAVYGMGIDVVADEDTPPRPAANYGRSKLAAERYITSHIPAGKRVFILRPGMIYGPGCKGNLPLLMSVVRRGWPWPLGAYDNRRSLLYIGNLNYIVYRLLVGDTCGGIYNVADDIPVSTTEIVTILSRAAGLRPRIWKVNKSLVRFVASIGDMLHLPLDSQRLYKLTGNFVVSNRKLLRALDIDALPYGPVEAMGRGL